MGVIVFMMIRKISAEGWGMPVGEFRSFSLSSNILEEARERGLFARPGFRDMRAGEPTGIPQPSASYQSKIVAIFSFLY